MLQNILTTFFVGQIAFEQAAEAGKKSIEAVKEKAEKAKESKAAKVAVEEESKTPFSFERFFKEAFAHLRFQNQGFETSCTHVAKFLGETAELKSQLAD